MPYINELDHVLFLCAHYWLHSFFACAGAFDNCSGSSWVERRVLRSVSALVRDVAKCLA